MLERAFTLVTARFNAIEVRPHFINDRCFGEDFAAWLALALRNQGFEVSDPIQEDWGWCLILTTDGRKFTLAIGVMDESLGQARAEWSVSLSYERAMSGLRNLFKPVPVAQFDRLASKLEAILMAEPAFGNVQRS